MLLEVSVVRGKYCCLSYKAGDVVLMSPINTLKGSVPTVLHLKWKDPHILMDFRCLARMGVRPGKV